MSSASKTSHIGQSMMINNKHTETHWRTRKARETYIGKSIKCKNGLMATCIDFQDKKHMTIQWPDGETVANISLTQFTTGCIRKKGTNPRTQKNKKQYTGQRSTANNGMSMEIKEYIGNGIIDIQFEDGTVCKSRTSNFKKRQIANPLYPTYKMQCRKNIKIGCINRGPVAYRHNLTNYYCECTICGLNDIMDWKDIHTHNATHGIPAEQLTWQYIQEHKREEDDAS